MWKIRFVDDEGVKQHFVVGYRGRGPTLHKTTTKEGINNEEESKQRDKMNQEG
jgi:hypothetical protein